jgi:uncharacterized protein YidB (DUF937 family)
MANDFMGQILGRVLGGGSGAAPPSGAGGGLGGVLGSILGGGGPAGADAPAFGSHGAITAMLLPLALEWVQRNGGIGGVLGRFQQKGYGQQANSWVSTSANQPLGAQQVREVVGEDELSRLAQHLGVDEHQVASGMAEILPQVIDHATPQGRVTPEADRRIDQGRVTLEQPLGELRAH